MMDATHSTNQTKKKKSTSVDDGTPREEKHRKRRKDIDEQKVVTTSNPVVPVSTKHRKSPGNLIVSVVDNDATPVPLKPEKSSRNENEDLSYGTTTNRLKRKREMKTSSESSKSSSNLPDTVIKPPIPFDMTSISSRKKETFKQKLMNNKIQRTSSAQIRKPNKKLDHMELDKKALGKSSNKARRPNAEELDSWLNAELQKEISVQRETIVEELVENEQVTKSKTRRRPTNKNKVLENVHHTNNEFRELIKVEIKVTKLVRETIESEERRLKESKSSKQEEPSSVYEPEAVPELWTSSEGTSLQHTLIFEDVDIQELLEENTRRSTNEHLQMFAASHKKFKEMIEKLTSPKKQIEYVVLGGVYQMNAFYRGSYPQEYSRLTYLHVCDGCFAYYRTKEICRKHMVRCEFRSAPPGNEIYKDLNHRVSVFQVDGEKFPGYCENLCLLTKLWLGSKTLHADVQPFYFFVVTDTSKGYYQALGYYSRQKSITDQNVSCLCVFPCYHAKGLGTFLVDFSYLVSRIEKTPGGPERPLSTMGERTYRSYWKKTLQLYIYLALQNAANKKETGFKIKDIIMATGIKEEDVTDTVARLSNCSMIDKKNDTYVVVDSDEELIKEGPLLQKEFEEKLFAREEYTNPKFVAMIEEREIE